MMVKMTIDVDQEDDDGTIVGRNNAMVIFKKRFI